MESPQQAAFQKLRQCCVDLSSVALKFRSNQSTSKAVLKALENVREVLKVLGETGALDEKLSEYAFFPLSTCFNETNRLSSHCTETAIHCLKILVSCGWKQKLPSATGKQLLILLSFIAGGGPGSNGRQQSSEELIVAAFECIAEIVIALGQSRSGKAVLDELGTTTVVDQVTFLLLEAVDGNSVEVVQLAALNALRQLWTNITNRTILASLLPRTVSALIKTLRPTTEVRRPWKVLVANLQLLNNVLQILFNDHAIAKDRQVATAPTDTVSGEVVLDASWLKATVSQIKLAIAQVVKLRSHERPEIREALGAICIMVIEECYSTLSECLTLVTETLVVVCSASEDRNNQLIPDFKLALMSHPAILDNLKSTLYTWTTSLPRIMLGSDDIPKQRILRQISYTFQFLSDIDDSSTMLDDIMSNMLCESITASIQTSKSFNKKGLIESADASLQLMDIEKGEQMTSFQPVLLGHQSQWDLLQEFQGLVQRLSGSRISEKLTSALVQTVAFSTGDALLSSVWLSVQFLRQTPRYDVIDSFLNLSDNSATSRPFLVEELYSSTVQYLNHEDSETFDWRLTALSLEAVVLQASQLRSSFRPEMIDILYPILSLLGVRNSEIREHAMVTLNILAKQLDYRSVSEMLVENADYLINSIALKLDTFDLSPQGPQVILMLLRLCGTDIIPYLDDVIGSIFAALDTFHGYPQLIEILFQVLNAVVEETSKSSQTLLTTSTSISHKKEAYQPSSIDDILEDLRTRRKRKARADSDTDPLQAHPKRPWSSNLGGGKADMNEGIQDLDDTTLEEDDSAPLPKEHDKSPTLSKPHTSLLSIARSTVPHLASPSPMVRLTCLNLLTQIIPLLGKDENSFLPVVNDTWEAVVSRLLPVSKPELQEDESFIHIAAAHTVNATCRYAGDFMTTRIEDIFPQLENLYKRTWSAIENDRRRHSERSTQPKSSSISAPPNAVATRAIEIHIHDPPNEERSKHKDPNTDLNGSVNALFSISSSHQPSSSSSSLSPSLTPHKPSLISPSSSSSPHPKFHTSLLILLTTILQHTHIPDNIGTRILTMVSPALFGRFSISNRAIQGKGKMAIYTDTDSLKQEIVAVEDLTSALEEWNEDAVWLVRRDVSGVAAGVGIGFMN